MGRRARGAAAAVGLGLITTDVACHGRMDRWERHHPWTPPTDAGPWAAITQLGDRPALATATLAATAAAGRRGRTPLRPLALVGLGVGARLAILKAVRRPRPPAEHWLEQPSGASFPSRHATSVTLGALALRGELPRSGALDLALASLVTLVAVSRPRLGVHWPSDVAAGILLGCAVDALLPATLDPTSRSAHD